MRAWPRASPCGDGISMSRRPILTTHTSAMADATRSLSRFRWSATFPTATTSRTDPSYREENVRVPTRSRSSTAGPSAGSTLTFKPAPAPWYRTRRGLFVLIAVIAVAWCWRSFPLLLRTPGPAPEEPTNVTPTTGPAPSSAPPTTGSVAADPDEPAGTATSSPTATSAGTAAAQTTHRLCTRSTSRRAAGRPRRRMNQQIDVTRAPISVAPEAGNAAVDGGSRR